MPPTRTSSSSKPTPNIPQVRELAEQEEDVFAVVDEALRKRIGEEAAARAAMGAEIRASIEAMEARLKQGLEEQQGTLAPAIEELREKAEKDLEVIKEKIEV